MKIIFFVLNFPYTLIGLIEAILCTPTGVYFNNNPYAFVFTIKKFRLMPWYAKKPRAATIGNVIMLGPRLLKNDLEHEFIHINQYNKYPVIYPFLYLFEMRKGYKQNRFEDEAYRLSNSVYEGDKR